MAHSPWRFCVAPMMDWTDRHCRQFHRLLSRQARLYTEMLTTSALIHGDAEGLLNFDALEHPVALQLGGSEPQDLAKAARLGEQRGYDEINLNCGCPSERVQRGAFGACLMREPALVADCFKAMADMVSVPVTIKHRLGLGKDQSLGLVIEFIGKLHEAGCRHFVVHARNAWLEGLSPKDNREVPPLRYADVYTLAQQFPDCCFVLNGGIDDHRQAMDAIQSLDGVMLGRAAYQRPALLSMVDKLWYRQHGSLGCPVVAEESPKCEPAWPERVLPVEISDLNPGLEALVEVLEAYRAYMIRQLALGVPLASMTRHLLGLFQGRPGARVFRRDLSDQHALRSQGLAWFDSAVSRFLTVQRTAAT
ncbi:MAG: tRNA dihydrouridine(20/20a) synthase DusA [Betaproteobacteria bacterium]|nr:tRNA dihydrouridine(20/20a) synthase DusA [Betaproteobacteria bacterium]NBO43291.1 tRNA dihydrouridine(20/20a) synthase DusA [Betaproteobacteria bacterium]NBP09287.1 tRNA dihydrouridine(20/20a) synthase DusA [Betaproteobacteria bacterium]NBQ09475.1 tRNA dihydrouridine(20/20a) synthase DusA [Betaproteobacteria bacterium]NBU00523.1 tRNA dihydrouridine(20/20a) synthase DusA [Betaproteobacteria bacterium]